MLTISEQVWRSAVAAITGIIALALIMLALPRTIAALLTIPSAAILRSLQNQEPVEIADLEKVVRGQQRGLSLVGDGRLATDLGLAELLIAERLPADDQGAPARFASATTALKDGLGMAPGNPYAWARLAYAEARQQGWTPLALSSLRLAFLTSPYDPRLLWSRLRLGFLAWPYMQPDDRDIVLQQIRWAFDENPKELARLAADADRVNVVRAALLRLPGAAAEFEKLLTARS